MNPAKCLIANIFTPHVKQAETRGAIGPYKIQSIEPVFRRLTD